MEVLTQVQPRGAGEIKGTRKVARIRVKVTLDPVAVGLFHQKKQK